MGRPPSNPGGRRSNEPVKKYFTVPIPPVDPRVHAAVESRIASTHPWLVQRAKLDKAESQLLVNRNEQELLGIKMEELKKNRAQALQGIQALRQEQLQTSLLNLEQRMRMEFAETQQAQVQQFQRECEDLINHVPPEEEQDEEPPTKRAKMETTETTTVTSDGQVEDDEDGEIQETTPSTSSSAAVEVANVASAPSTQQPQETVKPSQLKKKELENAEHELDGLTETKHQMIWLLKQVIKAEQKQKIQAKGADGK